MVTGEVNIPAPRLGTRGRARVAIEVLRSYRQVRRLSAAQQLPAVVRALRATPPRSRVVLPDPRVDGIRLGRAVIRTLWLVPGGTKCLLRSLVLLHLLARRGVGNEPELIIAVLPGPAMLDAHAWIELDGQALLPPGGEHERLLVL